MVKISDEFIDQGPDVVRGFLNHVLVDIMRGVDAHEGSVRIISHEIGKFPAGAFSDGAVYRGEVALSESAQIISVPICVMGVSWGVIEVRGRGRGGSFENRDRIFALMLGRDAGRILETAVQAYVLRRMIVSQNEREDDLAQSALAGKFAATVAHQVNSPLDGVLRYTNILLNYHQLGEETRTCLLAMRDGLQHMAEQIRAILYHTSR
jgi:signal transduction histidine kinase